jgi:hypothetical protein
MHDRKPPSNNEKRPKAILQICGHQKNVLRVVGGLEYAWVDTDKLIEYHGLEYLKLKIEMTSRKKIEWLSALREAKTVSCLGSLRRIKHFIADRCG